MESLSAQNPKQSWGNTAEFRELGIEWGDYLSLEGAQKWHATTARSGSETRSAALRKRKESPKLRALHFKFVPGEIQKKQWLR